MRMISYNYYRRLPPWPPNCRGGGGEGGEGRGYLQINPHTFPGGGGGEGGKVEAIYKLTLIHSLGGWRWVRVVIVCALGTRFALCNCLDFCEDTTLDPAERVNYKQLFASKVIAFTDIELGECLGQGW
jgi:hypothetical protein